MRSRSITIWNTRKSADPRRAISPYTEKTALGTTVNAAPSSPANPNPLSSQYPLLTSPRGSRSDLTPNVHSARTRK